MLNNDYILLADQCFDLQDYRNQVVNFMLNTEHFYGLDPKIHISILKKIVYQQLHKDDLVFKHFIQTIQICLTQKANLISVADFKRLLAIHNAVPIYHVPFLGALATAHNVL